MHYPCPAEKLMQKQRIGQLLPYLGSQTSNAGTSTRRSELISQTSASVFVSALHGPWHSLLRTDNPNG